MTNTYSVYIYISHKEQAVTEVCYWIMIWSNTLLKITGTKRLFYTRKNKIFCFNQHNSLDDC
jgi:hypothetical protein